MWHECTCGNHLAAIVEIAIRALKEPRSLLQNLLIRLLKVAWVSTIMEVMVNLAEGESHHFILI